MKFRTETAKETVREGFSKITGLFLKKQTPVAMVIHDGFEWHVYLYFMEEGAWHSGKTAVFQGRNPHQLPENLTAFAAENGAQRVRILIPSEVYTIGIELPEDCEPEEANSALSYELEGETELEAHAMRLAAVRADRFRMGGTTNNVLSTPFEISLIRTFDDACRAGGLDFEGLGAMELAVLSYHARNFGEARFLLLRQQNCFYVTPATQSLPFAAQSIPVSFSPEDAAGHPERYERIKRRFKTHTDLPVVIWSPVPPDEACLKLVREAAGEQTKILVGRIHDHTAKIARHAAVSRKVGNLFNGCALVGKGQKPKDPHRIGTWLFFSILILCVLTLGMRYLDMRWGLGKANARKAAWETLEKQRKNLKNKADNLRDERNNCQAVDQELSNVQYLPKGLLEILEMLRKEMPMYTRLVRLYQNNEGVLVLEGSTFYPEAIDLLSQAMCRVIQPLGLHVEPMGIEGEDLNGELRFTYQIISSKGGLL